MQEVGHPGEVPDAAGDLGRRKRQPGKADVVVAPVEAGGVAIGRALAVVEVRAEEHVEDEPVRRVEPADVASRQAEGGREPADDGQVVIALEHLAVAGDQDADVVLLTKAARAARPRPRRARRP